MTTTTALEPLNLTQGGVAEVTDETTTRRWYLWLTSSGPTWWPDVETCPASFAPDYSCDVTTPWLMAGSPEEIQAGVTSALHRHASRLGVS